ncbi:MAG: hypothetical protein JW969_13150 [Spirochaetales bacterium]|nr:hypothetical protein [Spirochaetales bacterium]
MLEVHAIDNIFKIKSPVEYIKHYIGHVQVSDDTGPSDFYIGFSLEYLPLGKPKVGIKFIDEPVPSVRENVEQIRNKILKMDEEGELARIGNKLYMEHDQI